MLNLKVNSENKLWGLLSVLLQPGMIAIGAVMLLYGLIFWSVDKGVSIDEGYYLLGYLRNQQLAPNTTDFHRIVRSIFFFIPAEDVLTLRWVRIILTIILLFAFIRSSHHWLINKHNLHINTLLYYSFGFLSGTMCFAYASPVIYYDNMQLMIYLLVFSLLFSSENTINRWWKYTGQLLQGFIMVFGLTNYPTSGALLIFIIAITYALFYWGSLKIILGSWLILFSGFVVGIIVYSLLIHNIIDFFSDAFWAYENAANAPKAKYHTGGQIRVLLNYFVDLGKSLLPFLGIITIYFLIAYKKWLNRIILNLIGGLILCYYTYKFSGYFSNLLLLPVLLLLADVLIYKRIIKDGNWSRKNILLVLLWLAIPFLAVIGSNQRIEMKMVYFMPFWFLAFFTLYAVLKKHIAPSRMQVWNYTFIIVFFVVFLAQGFIKHIHYNYSIKRSRHLIENAERYTNIGVSEYQRNFYENGIRELKKAGFKPGDEVLAFYETFMLVYAAGGYVPHRLTYSTEFFVRKKDNIPQKKVNWIIIDESQLPMISAFLESSEWGFPESYEKVELGTDGHNLTQLGYNYILYYNE